MVGDVTATEVGVGAGAGFGEIFGDRSLHGPLARGVAVVGGAVNEQRYRGGVGNGESDVLCGDGCGGIGEGEELGIIFDANLALFYGEVGVVVDGESFARECEPVGCDGRSCEVGWAIESGGEVQLAGGAGGEADDDDLVGGGAEDFASVVGAVVREAGGDDGGVEVELEAVVFRGVDGAEVEVEVAEGLVAGHAARDRHHVGEGEGFGFGDLAGKEEFADFGDGFGGFGVVAVAMFAVPDRVFVELDALTGGVAEDAGSETSVADGKRVGPLGGRLVEEEFVGGVVVLGDGGFCRGEGCALREGCSCGGGGGEESAAGGAGGHSCSVKGW